MCAIIHLTKEYTQGIGIRGSYSLSDVLGTFGDKETRWESAATAIAVFLFLTTDQSECLSLCDT